MAELKSWRELEPGGTVIPADAEQPHTGAWRTGVKPSADLSKCVNCLLCWLHCPDSAIMLKETTFVGFDFDYCKGCEICEQICPVEAITMVAEETTLPPLGVTR